jgi:hypothetical protein
MKIKTIRANVIVMILLSNLLIGAGFAQAPEKLSYQAVVRDAENYLITNADVGAQISILQSSPGGFAVYVETHIKETNINGLLTIEIGDGTVVSGEFENIDWSDGPYFILSEIDPTGGTNYSITGSSQLLSVPYALHAKTAESTVMETDPVFTASIAAGITATDTSYWNNKLDIEVDGDTTNELQSISRTGLTVTLSHGGGSYEDSVNTYVAGMGIVIDDTVISAKTYSVGDFAHGGIVFWVDETGQHGLVCTKTNQSSGIRWYAGSYTYTLAKGNGPLAGNMNTAIIISSQGYGDGNTNAARICAELQITEDNITYGDWYLPSLREMEIMFENKEVINTTALANGGGTFASDYYWSSTEYTNNHVWVQDFVGGVSAFSWKQNLLYVRAARRF